MKERNLQAIVAEERDRQNERATNSMSILALLSKQE